MEFPSSWWKWFHPVNGDGGVCKKIGLYLEAGAGAVVEVHYVKRNILVYRPESDIPESVQERIEWPFEAALTDVFAGL